MHAFFMLLLWRPTLSLRQAWQLFTVLVYKTEFISSYPALTLHCMAKVTFVDRPMYDNEFTLAQNPTFKAFGHVCHRQSCGCM